MPFSASSLPPGFSWLRSAPRPTAQEVSAFAHLIANAEGYPSEPANSHLLEEAELQLWTWRADRRKRAEKRRAASKKSTANHGPDAT